MNIDEFKTIVIHICGPVSKWSALGEDWDCPRDRLRFRLINHLPIRTLMALSDALGTDQIDLNFGDEGSTHYSDLTPGEPGSPGWVEVRWPIKERPEPSKTGVLMGPDFRRRLMAFKISLGYRVKSSDGLYIHRKEIAPGDICFYASTMKSETTSKSDAFRLMADWLDCGYLPTLIHVGRGLRSLKGSQIVDDPV